jgi:hypothetical protein
MVPEKGVCFIKNYIKNKKGFLTSNSFFTSHYFLTYIFHEFSIKCRFEINWGI